MQNPAQKTPPPVNSTSGGCSPLTCTNLHNLSDQAPSLSLSATMAMNSELVGLPFLADGVPEDPLDKPMFPGSQATSIVWRMALSTRLEWWCVSLSNGGIEFLVIFDGIDPVYHI